jgi:hypothetical protein
MDSMPLPRWPETRKDKQTIPGNTRNPLLMRNGKEPCSLLQAAELACANMKGIHITEKP